MHGQENQPAVALLHTLLTLTLAPDFIFHLADLLLGYGLEFLFSPLCWETIMPEMLLTFPKLVRRCSFSDWKLVYP